MSILKLGIVGSGMIAGVIADAISHTESFSLSAVVSRNPENARAFARQHGVENSYATWQELVSDANIDAVYVATPTQVKEEIAIQALKAGKHVLVDKPFASAASVARMIAVADENKRVLMDATHFSHHPRSESIKNRQGGDIGETQAIRTSFFFPFDDRSNIRFDPSREPMGAVGDMAWYSMRAIVEFMDSHGEITKCHGIIERDEKTGAVTRGAGMIGFANGKSSTFDFGYTAGVCQMDLDILGTMGMYQLSDFVLDWQSGFAFNNPDYTPGYTVRQGMAEPDDFTFIKTPSHKAQAVLMLDNFSALINAPTSTLAKSVATKALDTQVLLDAFWASVNTD